MSLTLKLNATSKSEKPVAGWQAESYTLAPGARAAGQEPATVKLEPDDVLELELENGTRLLVAAEDAWRYLGGPAGRGEAEDGEILVGPALRPAGPRLPPGPTREGFGAWVLKGLRVFRHGPAGITAVTAAGAFQDSQLEHRDGLHQLALDRWNLTPVKQLPATAEPVLIFLHGTASSTEGSFRALWGEKSPLDGRSRLKDIYGERIYGFEHRSLTESPIANALALVQALPEGARLHLVSHSRGGMVGELLARANRFDAEPFPAQDIQRFLEHAQETGRSGFEADADRLRQLNDALAKRSLKIERFVRVAAPARGTTLASGRLDRWASVMLNLFGRGLDLVPGLQPVVRGYDLLQNFLLAVVKERTDARLLPGLEAMMPDSPLVALLNAPDVEVESPLHVVAGDYRSEGLISWLVDCVAEAFYAGETDLVVNTPSMSGGARRRQGIWLKPLAGSAVHHLSYFSREQSALPLLEALQGSSSSYERLDGPSRVELARGGKTIIPKADGPIVLVLPGIMGSQLALRGNRIWFDALDMIGGGMAKLHIGAEEVAAAGWIDSAYEDFARFLAKSHEVRPFAYDWRLSIAQAAERFGLELDKAMADAERRRKPLRIAAHSMGGLVARLALKTRWARFKAIPGSRLVQFGTPNQGSHSIAAVLMGRDSFVQKIERWADWKHDMHEFLEIVRRFPGVLELLPWSLSNGQPTDTEGFFDAQTWQNRHQGDAENRKRRRGGEPVFEPARGAGDGWPFPIAEDLQAAWQTIQKLAEAPLDPDCTLYVAGSDKTPVAIRLAGGKVEIGWTRDGDGRVPWKTGIPENLRVWYVNASHGDLLSSKRAFADYLSLLENGTCRLPTTPVGARDAGGISYVPAPLYVETLYPSPEEVVAAALGGRPPRSEPEAASVPAAIEIIHGSLAGADTPVLIGAYAYDPLRGSAHFLDRLLGGRLSRAQALGRYPDRLGDAMVFLNPAPGARPSGAIVIGLGPVGELKPGTLTQALQRGLLEYARVWEQQHPLSDKDKPHTLQLSSLLVGTGYAGLSADLGMRSLTEALYRANRVLEQSNSGLRIDRICLFEEDEGRAVAAADALRRFVRETRYQGAVTYDGRIGLAQGRYRRRYGDLGGHGGWYRVHITSGSADSALRFTLITDRARNEVEDEPDQRQAVDGLIWSATDSTTDQPGLARALFELMVPNGFKEVLPDIGGLILGVDAAAAVYPWELMRDAAERSELPLAARIGLVRQLASPHGRKRAATVKARRLLAVGDTQSGFTPLPGAEQEAIQVHRMFQTRGYEANLLRRPDGQSVLVNLFDGDYRFIHLAAHGAVAVDGQGHTGMVLGPNAYLTAAQVGKLPRVPEMAFINCCHLGSMAADARPRWGKLAANLATAFIEMGCKAVVAAGWAVDDDAAATFSETFYEAMLNGDKFGEAVRKAREAAYRGHPGSNTWGAYQAYGDEGYRLIEEEGDTREDDWQAPDYLHAGQIAADLEQFHARIGAATEQERTMYAGRLEKIEAAARPRFYGLGEVRERLADAWAALGRKERAIGHYRAALTQPDAVASLRALEQLANLEIRLGAELVERANQDASLSGKQLGNERKRADAFFDAGLDRLEQLTRIGKTTERLSLLGSGWKRRTRFLQATDAKADKLSSAVEHMQRAYLEASDHSLEVDGERDYYPTLNALDGAAVLAARGKPRALEAVMDSREAWIEEAVRNAERRYLGERSFFHAFAELEAARVDAFLACLDGRAEYALTRPEIGERLAACHRDLLARLGNAREHDSALSHLRWLIDMLPPSGESTEALRGALRQLLEGISRGAG